MCPFVLPEDTMRRRFDICPFLPSISLEPNDGNQTVLEECDLVELSRGSNFYSPILHIEASVLSPIASQAGYYFQASGEYSWEMQILGLKAVLCMSTSLDNEAHFLVNIRRRKWECVILTLRYDTIRLMLVEWHGKTAERIGHIYLMFTGPANPSALPTERRKIQLQ